MIGINFLMRFVILAVEISAVLVVIAFLTWMLANALGLSAGSVLRAPFEFVRRTFLTFWRGLFR